MDSQATRIITINVGGKKFKTYYQTIANSEFFRLCFEASDENKIFVDRDPQEFAVIIRFLRNADTMIEYEYVKELNYYGIPFKRSQILNWKPFKNIDVIFTAEDCKYMIKNKLSKIGNLNIKHDESQDVGSSTLIYIDDTYTLTICRIYNIGKYKYSIAPYDTYSEMLAIKYNGILLDIYDQIKKWINRKL